MNQANLSSFIWSVADLLRGDYKQSEYGRVILPLTVLRRLDCVLEPTKEAVLKEKEKREAAGLNPEPFLLKKSGQHFYNTSPLDMKKLMGDQDNIAENMFSLRPRLLRRRPRHLRVFRLPRPTRPAGEDESALHGHRELREHRSPPEPGQQPPNGARLRGTDPQVRRALQRDRRGTLHAAFGVEWKKIKKEITKEHEQEGFNGRFGPGLPRVSDGSLLFLMHLLSKMRRAQDGGSRFGIVLNGSPLFTGGAGSGESEIRRYVLENDLLEAIIGLPTDMFYNTGISTYVWIVSNRKPKHRKGKVQLIDASGMWEKMRKSLGSKRKQLSDECHFAPETVPAVCAANGTSR